MQKQTIQIILKHMIENKINNIAVYIDYENIAHHDTFDISLLINKLKERGRLIIKKAYADWGRFSKAKRQMLENSVELIELPSHSFGKNSADIKLVVDSIETAITKDYIDTIIIVSGDSDYAPLISKLREYNKYVIVVSGAKKQTSSLLIGYCDELIYYSSLTSQNMSNIDLKPAFELLIRATINLSDKGLESRGAQIKQQMCQVDSSFSEFNYGFSQFKKFLEKAETEKVVLLKPLEHGDYFVSVNDNTFPENIEIITKQIQNEPDENQTHMIKLIYWAIKLTPDKEDAGYSLGNIANIIKTHLEPSFKLSKYGYSKRRGFKAVVNELEKQNYLKLNYEEGKNQYYIIPFKKFYEISSKFEMIKDSMLIKCDLILLKDNLTAYLEGIYWLAKTMTDELETIKNEGLSVNVQGLYDKSFNILREIKMHYKFRRAFSTILKINAIKDVEDNFILKESKSKDVGSIIPLNAIVHESFAKIIDYFSENLEEKENKHLINFMQEQKNNVIRKYFSS